MDERLRQSLARALEASWKHRPVSGAACAICGSTSSPLALHVIQYACAAAGAAPKPAGFVAQSESLGTVRGGMPLCTACAPPCRKCGLPVATGKVRSYHEFLMRDFHSPGTPVAYGNGICRHVRFLGLVF